MYRETTCQNRPQKAGTRASRPRARARTRGRGGCWGVGFSGDPGRPCLVCCLSASVVAISVPAYAGAEAPWVSCQSIPARRIAEILFGHAGGGRQIGGARSSSKDPGAPVRKILGE